MQIVSRLEDDWRKEDEKERGRMEMLFRLPIRNPRNGQKFYNQTNKTTCKNIQSCYDHDINENGRELVPRKIMATLSGR